MGEHSQTACALCRMPLFGVLDWSILAAMKSVIPSMAIADALCFLEALYEISRRNNFTALVWLNVFYLLAYLLWNSVAYGILLNKEHWWRTTPLANPSSWLESGLRQKVC